MAETYQLGWFSTGRDKAARDLLKAVQSSIKLGEIRAKIAFVFCSREPGESKETDLFLKLVESYHIPLVYFSYENFRKIKGAPTPNQTGTLPSWRLGYDREVMNRLRGFNPDLCVLAGYMLIVGAEMCRRYDMINLHPAAPGGPTGTWQEVIWQLIESKARQIGVMMHLVTPELDKGPPVTYCTFSIRGKPFDKYWKEIEGQPTEEIKNKQGENNKLFKLIRKNGLAREFPLIISTIKAFSQGKIRISPDKRVVDAVGKPLKGYDLTEEIDKTIKEILYGDRSPYYLT
jgi:folate-dependent phosphoribosylglycinamide formyltransferase PurN